MSLITEALAFVAEAAAFKLLGSEKLAEKGVQLMSDAVARLRANRPVTAPELARAADDPSVFRPALALAKKEVVAVPEEEFRGAVQLAVKTVLPELQLTLANPGDGDDGGAMQLLRELPGGEGEEGFWVLWLQPPQLQEGSRPCYCHFYWYWNRKDKRAVYTIRDLINGCKYYGNHRHGNPNHRPRPELQFLPNATNWGPQQSAVAIFENAVRRMRCRGLFCHPVTENDDQKKWKETLLEMTRTLAP